MLQRRPGLVHPASGRPGPGRRTTRRLVSAGLVVMVVAACSAGASYVAALTAPGYADVQVRTVDWVRGHGGDWLVNLAENWWYAHNQPSGSAPPPSALPATPPAATATPAAAAQPPRLPLLAGHPALAGEAQWVPNPQRVGGAPAMYTGYFRPDPAYPSQIVGVAWLDQSRVRLHLIAGLADPGGRWPAQAQVPPAWQPNLLAAFNSGWKLDNGDAQGGFYDHGRTAVALRPGAASLVIDTTGHVTIGTWGRDATMGPQVAAVRQNLDLIVQGGHPVAGLNSNAAGAWGSPKNQFQYTYRSGIGLDQTGNLIYLAGDQLTLSGLATAMTAAGVVHGMELDIHPDIVTFNTFHPDRSTTTGLAAAKLLPGMHNPATRYLTPDQRDFFAATLR